MRHAQGGSHGPSAAQRLAEVLIDIGARCGEPVGRGMQLTERLTHQVLADLSGAHRATVTTLLNDWVYEGIIGATSDNRLSIRRPGELWALAGYEGPRIGETSDEGAGAQVESVSEPGVR